MGVDLKGRKGEFLWSPNGKVWILANGTYFYKSGIINALNLGLQEQGRALGVTQGQGGKNLGGSFCKLPKGWKAL